MLFNSPEFIYGFLPISLILFYLLGRFYNGQISLVILIISSFVYYGWLKPSYLIIFVFSLLFNYGLAQLFRIYSNNRLKMKLFLILGISINVLILGYFKYTYFILDNLNVIAGTNYNFGKIILPLGISFFTFTQIAFLIESYRGNVRETNIVNYISYISFFPQLFAGPIVYHKEMIDQYKNKDIFKFNFNKFTPGFILFFLGLFKKLVIADNLFLYVSPVFDNTNAEVIDLEVFSFISTWKASIAYTFQLYFDFSGYTDMAIGVGNMFGIKLPMNFNSPYKSKNIVEFWRRWHMTLSRFFRDYVFLPMSFSLSRRLPLNSFFGSDIFIYSIGIFVTWALTGLWHGAGWTFIIWGVIHALLLIFNRIIKKRKRKLFKKIGISEKTILIKSFYYLITFISVVLAWVFFRSPDFTVAVEILKGMFFSNGFGTFSTDGILLLTISAIIVFIMPNSQEILSQFDIAISTYRDEINSPNFKIFNLTYTKVYALAISIIVYIGLLFLHTVQKSEFIYFDF